MAALNCDVFFYPKVIKLDTMIPQDNCDNTYTKETTLTNLDYHDYPLVNQKTSHINDNAQSPAYSTTHSTSSLFSVPRQPINDTGIGTTPLHTNLTNDTIFDLSLHTRHANLQADNNATSIRKSTRTSLTPTYLQDYVCNTTSHWCNLVSYEFFA